MEHSEHNLDEDLLQEDIRLIEKPDNLWMTALIKPSKAWPYIINHGTVGAAIGLFLLLGILGALEGVADGTYTDFVDVFPDHIYFMGGTVMLTILPNALWAWLSMAYDRIRGGTSSMDQFFKIFAWSTLPELARAPIAIMLIVFLQNDSEEMGSIGSMFSPTMDPVRLLPFLFEIGITLWIFARTAQGIKSLQQRSTLLAIATLLTPLALILILVVVGYTLFMNYNFSSFLPF